jgi:hypothetical protein
MSVFVFVFGTTSCNAYEASCVVCFSRHTRFALRFPATGEAKESWPSCDIFSRGVGTGDLQSIEQCFCFTYFNEFSMQLGSKNCIWELAELDAIGFEWHSGHKQRKQHNT